MPDTESSAHLVTFGLAPAAPTVGVTDLGDGRFNINWEPGIGVGALSYAIRLARAGEPRPVTTVAARDVRSWQSPVLAPGTYSIEVMAINSAGSASAVASAVLAPLPLPGPPTITTATSVDDVTCLTWQADSDGAAPAGFIIEAAASSTTPFFEVTRVALPELIATRVPTGTWLARVKAFTAAGISGPSNVLSVTARPCTFPPSAPRDLAYQVAARTVTLQWNFPAHGSADQYVIEVGSTSGVSNLGRLVTTDADPRTTPVAPPRVYFVRVRGQNACGVSESSNEILVSVR